MRTIRSLIFSLYKGFNGSKKKLDFVREIERYSLQELERYRRGRLVDLIKYAYSNVPYYRDTFLSTGMVHNNTVQLENFTNLPLLNKNDIRNNFESISSENLQQRKWRYKTTGGSTGEPLKVIHDDERVQWVNAVKDMRNEWSGMQFGDSRIRVWGSERDLYYGKETIAVRVNRWVNNTVWLNAFRLTPGRMFEFVKSINEKKPKQIKGYTTCLYELALFIEKNNLFVHSPDSIICSAGTVTLTVRKKIENVFGAQIFNSYGSREVQAMAFECDKHNGLHVMSPLVHMEIVDEHGKATAPGEIGEVVLTPFFNFAMPLLRYRIGDMAVMSGDKCSCGCNWPLIQNIEGRVTECFYAIDGTVVPPEFFIHLIGVVQNHGWIEKFQVIQEDLLHIVVKIVRTTNDARRDITSDIDRLSRNIKTVMSAQCRVEYQFVNEIPSTKSGKYLYTISKIEK